jgi:hypothetical protein
MPADLGRSTGTKEGFNRFEANSPSGRLSVVCDSATSVATHLSRKGDFICGGGIAVLVCDALKLLFILAQSLRRPPLNLGTFERSLARHKTCRRPGLDPGLGFFLTTVGAGFAKAKKATPPFGVAQDKPSQVRGDVGEMAETGL